VKTPENQTSRKNLISLLLILIAGTAATSLLFGPVNLSFGELWAALLAKGDPVDQIILWQLRLPRTALALLVGGMLGLAGAVLQGYLRNPLAEPSVLGVSNAAALGAVIALYFGLAELNDFLLPLLSIAGGLGALALLFGLAARRDTILSLILGGIAIGTLAGAAISLALNLSPNPFAAMEITTWLLGSLENRSLTHIWIALPCILFGAGLLLRTGPALDALSLGEDCAVSLGVDLRRLRLVIGIGVALGVGGAVAVSGAIGFIGLIVPHLVRPLTSRNPSAVLLPSFLGGAALLTGADVLVRLIPSTNELKLGVVTAFLGIPVFVYQLLRERRI